MTTLFILMASTLAFTQAGDIPPEPLPKLSELPNVQVSHYEVTGKDIPEIHKSLGKAAPVDPATGNHTPATSSWSISAGAKWTRTGDKCQITEAMLRFNGTASLPHLAEDKERPAPVLAVWDKYVAQLEARQARQLRFAFDRLDGVRQAILTAGCDNWQTAANAAIARIRAEQVAAFKSEFGTQPKLLDTAGTKEKKPDPSVDTNL